MEEFDAIFVGAGTAGCIAARTIVQHGFKVSLIDRKPREKIGDKICGDGVGKHHFDNLGLKHPSGNELAGRIGGIDVYSPDKETVFRVAGEGVEGFMINRYEFGQRLLNEALDQGVAFSDNTMALEPMVEGNFVKGVLVKDSKRGQVSRIYSKVTVDASGFAAALRKKLPSQWNLETVNQEDAILCYREIRKIQKEIDPNYCRIYLDLEMAPGGYCWIFPKGPDKVNVGLGVQMKGAYPSPKELLYANVLSQPLFKGSKTLTGGGGIVPTRRPLDCLVANGIMLTGDVACLVNPIHGGGIGPSMMSGKLAAETAVRAIENGDVSREGLWQYNLDYMQNYGAKQAGLDIFRIFLQTLTNEDLNFGMRHQLVTGEDILKTSLKGDLKLHITEKTIRVIRGLRRLHFLAQLRFTAGMMRKLKRLHQHYPKPGEFENWRGQIRQVYAEMREHLS